MSSCPRPVGTERAPRALRLWRACDAETVGSLSVLELVVAETWQIARARAYATIEAAGDRWQPLHRIKEPWKLQASPVT